ncbi:MAG: hypothetical protein WEA31_08415 [Pirellulales bacterium]
MLLAADRWPAWLGLQLLCLLAVGCGDGLPPTVEVHGRVTYQGQALPAGEVTFQSQGAANDGLRRPATGQIEAGGTYRLSTFSHGDGALPGEYRVAINSFVGTPPLEEIDGGNDVRETRIPLKYGNPATSGLQASVPTEGGQRITLDFDLP